MNNDKEIDNDVRNERKLNPLLVGNGEVLARELAIGLGDTKNLKYYQSVVKKYPEQLLLNIFDKVKNIPENKIRKSKGALFNYLLQKHGKYCHRD
jgi:hypothetical protein